MFPSLNLPQGRIPPSPAQGRWFAMTWWEDTLMTGNDPSANWKFIVLIHGTYRITPERGHLVGQAVCAASKRVHQWSHSVPGLIFTTRTRSRTRSHTPCCRAGIGVVMSYSIRYRPCDLWHLFSKEAQTMTEPDLHTAQRRKKQTCVCFFNFFIYYY